MLTKERIKEAEINVTSYLQDGLLKKAPLQKEVRAIFLQNGKESLRVANDTFQNKTSDLWVIVCSYYSMFYYANAVLLTLGYKTGEKVVHKVTSDALIVYVRKKLEKSLLEGYEEAKDEALQFAGVRADSLIESFDFERAKRGLIQYKTLEGEKHTKANTSLQRAKEFAKEMEKLM
ncbi:MAG TPA: hypothetical protein VJB12_02140 [Candidatus Nanoarchaeia archaeon]|nr:hypothetical protein [Candidatus Nanoarchaeia archaeon]